MNARDNKTAAWLRELLERELEIDVVDAHRRNLERALGFVRRLIKTNPQIPEGPRMSTTTNPKP